MVQSSDFYMSPLLPLSDGHEAIFLVPSLYIRCGGQIIWLFSSLVLTWVHSFPA